MTEKWTAERAIEDPYGWGAYLYSAPDDDPVAVAVGAELDAMQTAEWAALPPAERALAMKQFEADVDALVADLDEDDDPDPDGGEQLPLLRHLDEIAPRGPPAVARPPAPAEGGRVDGQDNNGAASIDPAAAVPQGHREEPQEHPAELPQGHLPEPPRGRPVDRFWTFQERARDHRGHATIRDVLIDVVQIRAIGATTHPDTPWRQESVLRVAGIRQAVHVVEDPVSIVRRLEMLASGEVRLRGG